MNQLTLERFPDNSRVNEDDFIVPDHVPKDWEVQQDTKVELPETYGDTALEQMRAYREEGRLSAGSIMGKMEAFESRLDAAAEKSAEKSRDKSAAKGRSEKSTKRRAASREMLVKSGPYALIGATALAGTFLTGGGTALVGGAFAARTAVRTSRGVHRGNKNLEQDKDITAKIETDSDDKWIQRSVKLANVLTAPERKATQIALNFMRKTDKEVTERRRLISHAIGAVVGGLTIFGAGRFARAATMFADRQMVGTAHAAETTPGHLSPLDNPMDTLKPQTTGQAEHPNGSGPSPSEHAPHYNRFEAHKHGMQDSSLDKFDWGKASPKEVDAHTLRIVGNRPDMLAQAMEIREHGVHNFSEARVNARIKEYTVSGKNGQWSAKGLKDLETLKHSWDNSESAHIMTPDELAKLQADGYHLVNHGTRENRFLSGRDDTVFRAQNVNFHPELGDRLSVKELNGQKFIERVNDKIPSRSCKNLYTLEKTPPETPGTHATPETPGTPGTPGTPATPETPGTPGTPGTPPETKVPPVVPPETSTPPPETNVPPVVPPEVIPPEEHLTPKKPGEDITVNPNLPPQVQMGGDRVPAGPPTVNPVEPPSERPDLPAPQPHDIPRPAPGPVEAPAPGPSKPGGPVASP